MESNQTENLPNSLPIDSTIKTEWIAEVTNLIKNLWYPSESDEPIEWIGFRACVPSPLTVSDLEFYQGIPPEVVVEEVSVENFWTPVTTIEDWFGEDEKAQAALFLTLKQLIEANLKDVQAFRVGRFEIDVYLLGQINESEWGGLKTKVVET